MPANSFLGKYSDVQVDRKFLCMHITALRVFGKILFVAEGNQISLLDISRKKIIDTEVVFSSSSVHGIRTYDHKVLCFGSKSLRVYSCDIASPKCLKSISPEITLFDWLHDVQWIASDSSCNKVAAISAHNAVTILDVNDRKKLNIIQCAENCIIYAANIISTSETALIVAVGTVFKQILIWSPNSDAEVNNSKVPFHCLEGHQGVIFSVSFNKHLKLLSSTSDDRSIRLWKVSSSSDDTSSLEFWKKSSITFSHVLYAHESRVWTSTILDNCILSVGEDSCICFWDINGQLLKRKKCHKGGSIWCLETNYSAGEKSGTDSLNSYVAFTGGSDGGVYCWDIQNILAIDLVSQISLHVRSPEKDFPRVVSLIQCNESQALMATTDKGWLSFYDMNRKSWKDIYHDVSFSSYCVSSVSNKSIIALGNLLGDLVLLNSNDSSCKSDIKKFKIHPGKIFALHWVNKSDEYLLSCGSEGHMILWRIKYQDCEYFVNSIQEFHLPKCKPHWWSTCAVYVTSFSCLIVGDRGGSISFYSMETDSKSKLDPCIIHKHVHGENGVTDIQEHQSLIYSAGRDGRVLLYYIDKGSLNLLHAIKISHDLEWIGKIILCGSDMLLLGFYTKYFIVWSTQLESTVMTVECGGGHRSWDFCLTEQGQAMFTAIKKKDIIFTKEDLSFSLNKSILKAGVSGREFCQTCYLFTIDYDCSKTMSVLAAGGEDNALQIIGLINGQSNYSQITSLYTLSGHLSSIRSLAKTTMMEENTFLLATVGGRAQMILWKIKKDSGVICEQIVSYVLSSSEKKVKRHWKESQHVQVDPQTRLMDVTLGLNKTGPYEGENYIIALACSDSYFRVYNFEVKEKILSLIYCVQLGEHCILRLHSILNTEELDKNIFFLIASTDGYLNFVCHEDLNSSNALQSVDSKSKAQNEKINFKIKLHQSGINALDVKHISGKMWFICTTGDDNAISAMHIEVHPHLSLGSYFKILRKTQVYKAHASQITGLKILGTDTIVSASIDQRINVWKLTFESNSLNLTLMTSKMSLIPDIANLECWENGNCKLTAVVCGEGIEGFSLENIS